MRVVFRVDASLQMGTGHMMRCLTLAQVLKENGADVEFICRNHKGNLIDKIRSSGFVVHELKVFEETEVDTKLVHSHWLGATQRQDADDCVDILKAEKYNWFIGLKGKSSQIYGRHAIRWGENVSISNWYLYRFSGKIRYH